MFRVVDVAGGDVAGSVGFWERSWRGEDVYEIGWAVLPAFQSRGVAAAATAEAILREGVGLSPRLGWRVVGSRRGWDGAS